MRVNKPNRSEFLTNQRLRSTHNQWYTNPYTNKDNVKDNKGGLGVIVFIICMIIFAPSIIDAVLSTFGI